MSKDDPSASSDVDGDVDEDYSSESTDEHGRLSEEMKEISFGALADAQDSLADLHSSRIRGARSNPNEDKLQAMRRRLAELRKDPAGTRSGKHKFESAQVPSRASKHAPREQTSRRPVSRVRPVIELSGNPQHIRDPRFSSITTHSAVDLDVVRKNYDFLKDYRTEELSALKASLASMKAKAKRRKSGQMTPAEVDEADVLKRQINSIENKRKSEDAKERERNIIRKHRQEERQKIKEGKTPFFMKRGEAKKQAQQQIWDNLKSRDRKKLKERREKRQSHKERRIAAPGLAAG